MNSNRRRLFAFLKLALLLIVLAFVGWSIAAQLRQVKDWSQFHPSSAFVLLSGLALLGVSCVQMLGYKALLGAYGAKPTYRQMAAIAWVPPLGKYVPGKVVALVGAMAMLHRYGIQAAVAATVVLMLDALAVMTGLITSTPVLFSPTLHVSRAILWVVPALVIGGIVFLHPRIFVRLLNLLLGKLNRSLIPRAPSLLEYLPPIALAFAQWLFAGLALWCMARAFVPELSIAALGSMISLAAGAMTISYLALFAPGGLGVRELIYNSLLPAVLPSNTPIGTAALIIVAMRVWQTVIELILAGIGLSLDRTSPTPPPPAEKV